MDAFLAKLKEDSKITIYALPLLALSKFSFDGFVSSYINREGTHLCVETKAEANLSLDAIAHPHLRLLRQVGDRMNFWYTVPIAWWPDMALLVKGRYSMVSEEAKSMIRTYSGLPYRVQDPDGYELYTDYRLLALDRDASLRKKWESLIRPERSISKYAELMDAPDEQRDFREFQQ